MKMIKLLLTLCLPLVFSSCDVAQFQKDMAHLESEIVPLWVFCETHNLPLAKKQFLELKSAYQKFESTYRNPLLANTNWDSRYQKMGQWLDGVEQALNQGSVILAQSQLDHFQYQMIDLRWKLNISFYTDAVWEFQWNLAWVADIVADPFLCNLEWEDIEHEIETLIVKWEEVKNGIPNAVLFDWPKEKYETLAQIKAEMEVCIADLEAAFKDADRAKLDFECNDLQPATTRLIMLFGSFEVPVELVNHL